MQSNLPNSKLPLINNSFEIYDDNSGYINHYRMFHAFFNKIPNVKFIRKIEVDAARKWVLETQKENFIQENYCQEYRTDEAKLSYDDHFFIFKNNWILNIYSNCCYILFDPVFENEATIFLESLKKFIVKPNKKTTEISLIVNARHGLETKELEVKKPKLNINLHYNDDFAPIHKSVLQQLRKPKSKGLFLFHGKPGTGKSTYIKYLMHQQNKQVIFLSPNMAANLDNMALTEFLMDTPNCVLVIEDAEDLIISRDNFHNSKLSFILNLTDGILGDSLGIQIIATFNTDLKNIDKALLRKGRLSQLYEFKALETTKANTLLAQLGDQTTNVPMTLADIFNVDNDNNYNQNSKTSVGFKATSSS